MKPVQLLALLLPMTIIAGCADGGGATATAGAAVNTVCPMMGGKVDGETTVEWNGQTIGFCCPPCIDAWNEMSDAERTKALAEAGDEPSEHGDPHSHEGHGEHEGHGDHEGHEADAHASEHAHGEEAGDAAGQDSTEAKPADDASAAPEESE